MHMIKNNRNSPDSDIFHAKTSLSVPLWLSQNCPKQHITCECARNYEKALVITAQRDERNSSRLSLSWNISVMSLESPMYRWRSVAQSGHKRSKCSAVYCPVPHQDHYSTTAIYLTLNSASTPRFSVRKITKNCIDKFADNLCQTWVSKQQTNRSWIRTKTNYALLFFLIFINTAPRGMFSVQLTATVQGASYPYHKRYYGATYPQHRRSAQYSL